MGLWSALKNLDTDYLFLDDDLVAAQKANASAQVDLIRQRADAGTLQANEASKLEQMANSSVDYDAMFAEPGNSPTAVFTDEVGKNFTNMVNATTGAVRGTIGFSLSTVFKLLPWWLWAIVAVVALFWLTANSKIGLKLFTKITKIPL